jgi:carbon storage regulator
MLYLTRKIGESVMINDTIEVTVVEVRGKSIKLGFTFPQDVSVLRREIYDRVQAENRAAAETDVDALPSSDLLDSKSSGQS